MRRRSRAIQKLHPGLPENAAERRVRPAKAAKGVVSGCARSEARSHHGGAAFSARRAGQGGQTTTSTQRAASSAWETLIEQAIATKKPSSAPSRTRPGQARERPSGRGRGAARSTERRRSVQGRVSGPRRHAGGRELERMEAPVHAVVRQELVVGAFLHDAALVEHGDPMGEADGGQAVGDEDDGPPLGEVGESLLDDVLALGVEIGGRLVQDEDRRDPSGTPAPGRRRCRWPPESFTPRSPTRLR